MMVVMKFVVNYVDVHSKALIGLIQVGKIHNHKPKPRTG